MAEKLSPLERVGWTAGTVVSVALLLGWLFPDLPLAGKFIIGVPSIVIILIALVWPDRQGEVYPKGIPSNPKILRSQRRALLVWVEASVLGAVLTYTIAFPDQTPSFLRSYPPAYLPWLFNLQNLIYLEVVNVIGFLIMLRHYIRSLPPKEDGKSAQQEATTVPLPSATSPKVVRKTVQIVSCLFCGKKYNPTALELQEAHYVGLNHPITCRNCGKTATVVDVIEED